jgi:hypothetical protein
MAPRDRRFSGWRGGDGEGWSRRASGRVGELGETDHSDGDKRTSRGAEERLPARLGRSARYRNSLPPGGSSPRTMRFIRSMASPTISASV